MNIPKQLRKKSIKFIKINFSSKQGKSPMEPSWQTEANYRYTEAEFQDYLKSAKAYGVVCGIGTLAIVDCDDELMEIAADNNLPESFKIRTGGGGTHIYYFVPDLKEKVILEHKGTHLGEIQWKGAQALGPGSLHKATGKHYKVINNVSIATISAETLRNAFKPYWPRKEKSRVSQCISGIDMDIQIVLDKYPVKYMAEKGGEQVGPHPTHNSASGENFHVDNDKNMWHCFRHNTGGDTLTLIAMLEGYIDCSQCVEGGLTGDTFKKTKKIAYTKYGLGNPPEGDSDKPVNEDLTKTDIELLKKPNLLFNIIKEIHTEGVAGEELAQLVLINKISMRLVKNASETSSNLLVSDRTGGGKDKLTGSVCKVLLVDEQTVFHETAITPKVLNYWEPLGEGSSWDGRVVYLEDPEVEVLKLQAFKIRASGSNNITTLDDKRKVRRLHIKGKHVFIITSMNHAIDEELMRRWDALRLDTSIELTKKVVDLKCRKAAGLWTPTINKDFRACLQKMPRVSVIVPFAPDLASYAIRYSTLSLRSQIDKLLDFIKASAALHQFQRERDSARNIIANYDDYYYGVMVFLKLGCINPTVLSVKEEQWVNELKKIYKEQKKEYPDAEEKDIGWVKPSVVAERIPKMSAQWYSNRGEDLIQRGLINEADKYDPAGHKHCKHMKYAGRAAKVDLPTVEALEGTRGYLATDLINDINLKRKKDGLSKVKSWDNYKQSKK